MKTCRAGAERLGITLLELLVVIGILTLLFGLLCSAVQRSRLIAARLDCTNRIRQLAMAIHAYHDVFGSLPPGTASPPLSSNDQMKPKDPFPLLNWSARITPFLDQSNVWREVISYYQTPLLSQNIIPTLYFQPIQVFQCPSDSPRAPGIPGRAVFSPLSYLGVSGTNSTSADGVLFLDSKIRFADITDGTSNTLLLGERPPTLYGAQGRVFGGWGYWGPGDAYLGVLETSVSSPGICPNQPGLSPSSLTDACAAWHFWSFHPGGANFGFSDGSVRFLSYRAPLDALATRANGETPE